MLALSRPGWQISGIDIQEPLINYAIQNARRQGLAIDFQAADLREYTFEAGFDLIVSNPPWQKAGSGISSPDLSRQISRRELYCTLPDILACIQRNLCLDGNALILYPQSRARELEHTAPQYLLDTIQSSPCSGTNKYLIYHLRLKGNTA